MPLVNYSIRIRGEGVSPETVRASDLALFLQMLEQFFVETARNDPTGAGVAISLERATFSLVAIAAGSSELTLSVAPSFAYSLHTLDEAIRYGRTDQLSDRAFKHLVDLSGWAAKRSYDIDFGSRISPATLSHERPIRSEEVHGTTTLYGECLRVGGDRPPTMRLRLVSGSVVTCKVNAKMAQELGRLLYTEIGVEGNASWSRRNMRLLHFEVTRLLPYRKTSIREAFQSLADEVGRAWADVTDAETWVDEQRGTNRL